MNDEQAIRDSIAAWLTAAKEGDARAMADLLDDEMLFVVRDRPPFGKTAFLAGGAPKPHSFQCTVAITEVVVNGDWALTRVQLTIEMTAVEGGPPARMAGPTMAVWRRSAAGRWRIWRDSNMVAAVA